MKRRILLLALAATALIGLLVSTVITGDRERSTDDDSEEIGEFVGFETDDSTGESAGEAPAFHSAPDVDVASDRQGPQLDTNGNKRLDESEAVTDPQPDDDTVFPENRRDNWRPPPAVDQNSRTDDDHPPRRDGDFTSEEKFHEELIDRGMEEFRPLARECYRQTVREFPEASGQINLQLVIEAEHDYGRVSMSDIGEDTTLYETSLHECLTDRIIDVEFEPPADGGNITVDFPWHFVTAPDDNGQ